MVRHGGFLGKEHALIRILLVGSQFGDLPFGEFKRADGSTEDGEDSVRLILPHNRPRRVVSHVGQSHLGRVGMRMKPMSESTMGMIDQENVGRQRNGTYFMRAVDECNSPYRVGAIELANVHQSKIQQQLVNAQGTIFDSEIYALVRFRTPRRHTQTGHVLICLVRLGSVRGTGLVHHQRSSIWRQRSDGNDRWADRLDCPAHR